MAAAMRETERRRTAQEAYNRANGITPQSIQKSLDTILCSIFEADYVELTEDPLDALMQGATRRAQRKAKKTRTRG
jgi:excinuclease ABC subunit B